MNKQETNQLKQWEKRIRIIAEDLDEPANEYQVADPKFYVDRLRKIADDIEQYIAGSGTGKS